MCLWIVKLVNNQFESAMPKKLYDLKGQVCNITFCRNSGNSSNNKFTKCEFWIGHLSALTAILHFPCFMMQVLNKMQRCKCMPMFNYSSY